MGPCENNIFSYQTYITVYFSQTHARTLALKHPPGDRNRRNVRLIRHCTVPIHAHDKHFRKRSKINEFKLKANSIPSCTFYSRVRTHYKGPSS